MKPTIIMMLKILLTCVFWMAPAAVLAHPHLLDVKEKVEVAPDVMLDDLRQAQVIFVGELHDNPGHHQAQLSIIDALDNDERPLAIGLEMFRRDSQEDLDVWTAGKSSFWSLCRRIKGTGPCGRYTAGYLCMPAMKM